MTSEEREQRSEAIRKLVWDDHMPEATKWCDAVREILALIHKLKTDYCPDCAARFEASRSTPKENVLPWKRHKLDWDDLCVKCAARQWYIEERFLDNHVNIDFALVGSDGPYIDIYEEEGVINIDAIRAECEESEDRDDEWHPRLHCLVNMPLPWPGPRSLG